MRERVAWLLRDVGTWFLLVAERIDPLPPEDEATVERRRRALLLANAILDEPEPPLLRGSNGR